MLRDYEQPPVDRVFVSSLQGDINTKEQKRREQVKMERNLRAQIEDNEKRRSGEKHRGVWGGTQTLKTDELAFLQYSL